MQAQTQTQPPAHLGSRPATRALPSAGGSLTSIALEYLAAGLSPLPATVEKKYPILKWGPYQTTPATRAEIETWFKQSGLSIGIACGVASGNLEVIDIDNHGSPSAAELYAAFCRGVEAQAPGLMQRLPVESTQSSGYHIAYRCATIEGSQKLAWRESTEAERTEAIRQHKTKAPQEALGLIETRGIGGFLMTAPSPGYRMLRGSWRNVPTITEAERAILLSVARSLSLVPPPAPRPARPPTAAPARPPAPTGTDLITKVNNHFNLIDELERRGARRAEPYKGGFKYHCFCSGHKNGDANPSIVVLPGTNPKRGPWVVQGFGTSCKFWSGPNLHDVFAPYDIFSLLDGKTAQEIAAMLPQATPAPQPTAPARRVGRPSTRSASAAATYAVMVRCPNATIAELAKLRAVSPRTINLDRHYLTHSTDSAINYFDDAATVNEVQRDGSHDTKTAQENTPLLNILLSAPCETLPADQAQAQEIGSPHEILGSTEATPDRKATEAQAQILSNLQTVELVLPAAAAQPRRALAALVAEAFDVYAIPTKGPLLTSDGEKANKTGLIRHFVHSNGGDCYNDEQLGYAITTETERRKIAALPRISGIKRKLNSAHQDLAAIEGKSLDAAVEREQHITKSRWIVQLQIRLCNEEITRRETAAAAKLAAKPAPAVEALPEQSTRARTQQITFDYAAGLIASAKTAPVVEAATAAACGATQAPATVEATPSPALVQLAPALDATTAAQAHSTQREPMPPATATATAMAGNLDAYPEPVQNILALAAAGDMSHARAQLFKLNFVNYDLWQVARAALQQLTSS